MFLGLGSLATASCWATCRHDGPYPGSLNFDTVVADAMIADYGDVKFPIAVLGGIVGFKRLADRPRDRNDLIGLEEIHDELPIDPIPGLDR